MGQLELGKLGNNFSWYSLLLLSFHSKDQKVLEIGDVKRFVNNLIGTAAYAHKPNFRGFECASSVFVRMTPFLRVSIRAFAVFRFAVPEIFTFQFLNAKPVGRVQHGDYVLAVSLVSP